MDENAARTTKSTSHHRGGERSRWLPVVKLTYARARGGAAVVLRWMPHASPTHHRAVLRGAIVGTCSTLHQLRRKKSIELTLTNIPLLPASSPITAAICDFSGLQKATFAMASCCLSSESPIPLHLGKPETMTAATCHWQTARISTFIAPPHASQARERRATVIVGPCLPWLSVTQLCSTVEIGNRPREKRNGLCECPLLISPNIVCFFSSSSVCSWLRRGRDE